MRFACAVEALTQPPSVLRLTIQYISFVVQVCVRWALRRPSPPPPAQRRIAGYVLNARSRDRNPAPCEGSASFAVTMVRGRAGLTSTSNLAASGGPSRARIRLTSCHLLSSRRTSRLHTPCTPTTARHDAWSTPSCLALASCYIRRAHLQAEPINAACEVVPSGYAQRGQLPDGPLDLRLHREWPREVAGQASRGLASPARNAQVAHAVPTVHA